MATETWAELREAGQKHFQAKEYEEAAKCFRQATNIQPGSPESWRALGFALNASGQYSEAVGAFQSSIGLDPNNAEGFFGVGLAYASNADDSRAIHAFDEALKIKPNHTAAKNSIVDALLRNGQMLLNEGDAHGGEQALERAYKLMRTSDHTVVPFVQHLIVSQQHKKAFDIIKAARLDAPDNPAIKALEEQMDGDPKLAHAKQVSAAQPQQRHRVQAQRPTQNPDQVTCPCGAAKVMKWATVCPTCNQRIGDPSKRSSAFAGHEDLKGYTWIDVCYYIFSSLWLLWGVALLLLGLLSGGLGGIFVVIGAINAGVALGLLYQVEWVQFVGKILMIVNFLGGTWQFMLGIAIGSPLQIVLGFIYTAMAAFFWWLISQLSD